MLQELAAASHRMLDTWLKVKELGSLLSSIVALWTQSDHAYCKLLVWNGHIDGPWEHVHTRCSIFATALSSLNLSTGSQLYVVIVKMIPLTHRYSFLPFLLAAYQRTNNSDSLGLITPVSHLTCAIPLCGPLQSISHVKSQPQRLKDSRLRERKSCSVTEALKTALLSANSCEAC